MVDCPTWLTTDVESRTKARVPRSTTVVPEPLPWIGRSVPPALPRAVAGAKTPSARTSPAIMIAFRMATTPFGLSRGRLYSGWRPGGPDEAIGWAGQASSIPCSLKLLLDAEPRDECFARVFVGVETAAFHAKRIAASRPKQTVRAVAIRL